VTMLSRFDIPLACDRQTDIHLAKLHQHSHSIASCSENATCNVTVTKNIFHAVSTIYVQQTGVTDCRHRRAEDVAINSP